MNHTSFFSFIFKNKTNQDYWQIALAGLLVQIIIFKILYPFPDFISDSYNYIETAQKHLTVNLWPVGYAWFIGFVHFISSSHLFLVICQFIILEMALFYFFFSVLCLFDLTSTSRIILYLFLFFNPAFLYLSNCVLSDALFLAISITLFTQYLWMLRKPRIHYLIIQTLLIAIAFTIRYTAIYYPVVSIVAILLSGYKLPVKLAGMVAPWVFILPFIFYTQQQTKAITGTPEFSVFGGWQIANNALYMYEHIKVDPSALPEGTAPLDSTARVYFRETAPHNPPFEKIQGTYFMKLPNAILKPYYYETLKKNKVKSTFASWGLVSPVYKKYGTWLIKKYPFSFARYYLWLNTKNYFVPYPEKFGSYNVGQLTMSSRGKDWFQLPSNKVSLVPSIHFQGTLFYLYPFLFLLLNFYFGIAFGIFLYRGTWKNGFHGMNNSILLVAAFLLINFGFSVFATPVVLRYQLLPMILLLCFSLLLTEYLYKRPSKS